MKHSHFNTNENLRQLDSHTLIVGVDAAKKSHVARAVDYRGVELSKTLMFPSNSKGFLMFHKFMGDLLAIHDKTSVIVGLEPTGVYGSTLIQFLRSKNIEVVLVLGSQVAKAKELDDNTPSKNDCKDALTICKLIQEGRFRRHREFDGNVSKLKEAMSHNHQLTKNLTRVKCQIDNWLCLYFPEFQLAFKDWTKKTAYATLKTCPLPKGVLALKPRELVQTWRESGVIKGIGMKKAEELRRLARYSTGITAAPGFAATHIRGLLAQYEMFLSQSDELWASIDILVKDMPLYETLSGIPHIGKKAICGITAEIGDPFAFSHPRQLIRLAGLSLRESSSGGRRGASRITKRGRPHLRHWLYVAVLNLLKEKEPSFWAPHLYYTKRRDNPLKKMRSVIALCCKLLRVIHGMCIHGTPYDPRLVTPYLAANMI